MGETLERAVRDICEGVGNDRARLMDIVRAVQARYGCVGDDAINTIASALGLPRVEVESVVSFYAFLSKEQKGRIVIRLCNDVVDRMKGVERVAQALSEELGLAFGETTKEGAFTLEWTPCIGMCDQAPAALVNDVVVTNLSTDKAREMVRMLRKDPNPRKLVQQLGARQQRRRPCARHGRQQHPPARPGDLRRSRTRQGHPQGARDDARKR